MALRRAERERQHRLLEFNPEGVDADGQPLPCFDEDDSRFLDADIPEAEIAAADRRDSLAGAVEEEALPLAPSPPPLPLAPPPPIRRRVHSSDALGTTLVRPPSAARPVVVLGNSSSSSSTAGGSGGAGLFANSLRPFPARPPAVSPSAGAPDAGPGMGGAGGTATAAAAASPAAGVRGAVEVQWGALTLRTSVAPGMTVAELARKVAAQHAAMQGVPADAELDLLAPDSSAVLADADLVFDLVAPGARLAARVRAPRATAPGIAPAVRTALLARATVRTLDLAAQVLDAASLAALCAALPHLRVLERLSAAQTGLTAAHAPALADALAACPALTALSLARNALGGATPAQLAALARIARLPQLVALSLAAAALPPALLPLLAQSSSSEAAVATSPPALARLDVAENDLLASQSASALLAALAAYPVLEEANLERIGLGEASTLPLAGSAADALPLPLPLTLHSVWLRHNVLAGAPGALVVGALARLPALRVVDAAHCRAPPPVLARLLALPAACVCAPENPLPRALTEALVAPAPRLRAVVLAACALGLPGVVTVLRALLASPAVTAIDLSSNSSSRDSSGDGEAATAAAAAADELVALGTAHGGFRALAVLDLSRCGVPGAAAARLAGLWRTAHPPPAPGSSVLASAALDQLLLGSRSALHTHLRDSPFFSRE